MWDTAQVVNTKIQGLTTPGHGARVNYNVALLRRNMKNKSRILIFFYESIKYCGEESLEIRA